MSKRSGLFCPWNQTYNFTVELRLDCGLLSSLLPTETRRRLLHERFEPTARDSALSGLLELGLSVSALARMFFTVVPAAISGYVGQAGARPGGDAAMVEWAGGVPVAYGMGFSAFVLFLLRWQTLVGAYFAFEGAVRAFAGFGADEVVPSMPIRVAEFVFERARRGWYELNLPPRVVDKLSEDGEWLIIESCRPKADWHKSACISYQERLYEIGEESVGSRKRPWVYRLRPAPVHKVVRGLRCYDPQDEVRP